MAVKINDLLNTEQNLSHVCRESPAGIEEEVVLCKIANYLAVLLNCVYKNVPTVMIIHCKI